MKEQGYLVFTTHDGDELDARLVPKEVFDKLKTAKDQEEALDFWNAEAIVGQKYFAQAPGDYKWPFNDVEILGTFYLLVY